MLKIKRPVSLFLLVASLSLPMVSYAESQTNPGNTAISQQKKKVTGTIRDVSGPVAGASIVIPGTSSGAISDLDGKFSLEVKEGESIQVSFLGYQTQLIKFTGQTSLDIILIEDSHALNEVVVTALGIQKDAKKLGYAVSTISSEDLIKTGTPNFATSLYGKASGVRIQAAPGGSTSAVSINIRGLSSITGTNQPLIIVDGVPIRNGEANNDGYWTDQRVNSNGLVDINPEDIESLSILKGASASALYGSEAANGVVMITTKSGKGTSGIGVDFSANVSFDNVAYMPEIQTVFGPGYPARYMSNSYEISSGGFIQREVNGQQVKSIRRTSVQFGPKYDGSDVYYWDGEYRPYNAITRNQWKDIFRTGINQTYNVAITQGSEKSNTRFSYTYADNRPTQYNSSYNKHNFNLVGSNSLNEKIKIDYTVNYIRQDIENRPYRISRLTNNYGGMFGSFEDVALIREKTVTSLGYKNTYGTNRTLTPDESFAWQPYGWALLDEYFWNILGRKQAEENNRLIASVTPTWKIIDGLTLRGRAATDFTSEKIEKMENTESPIAFGTYTGYYGLNNKRYEIYYSDVLLMYDKQLTDKIGLTANVGWQGRMEKAFNSEVGTNGGLSVENWFHINASKNAKNANMLKQEFMKTALLGTLSLSYDNYLYLEGTLRQEKISTLSKGNNSYTYPSVNGSFIFTEALKDSKPDWYDYGKVRVSYGIVGNAPEIYKAVQAYNQSTFEGYIYNNVDGKLGNETIRPEEKHELEFGLESKFFNNRLGFEISYYTNKVKDQILETTMPQSAGGTSILLNVGELQNNGLDISVYGTPVETKDFRWDLRGNLSFNKNKVNKLQNGLTELVHTTWDGAVELKSIVGESMGDLYAYVPKEDANGNKIVDEEGLYIVDYTERKKVGNAMPKAIGGIGTSFNYKNFFVDATVDFRIGGAVLNQPYQYMMNIGNIVESLDYRDAAHGGLTYYFEGNDVAGGKTIATRASAGPNGEKVYDNGVILPGVKENGSANDIIVPSDFYYAEQYGWGSSGYVTYEKSIIDNSYVKFRELSLGYSLPKVIASKLACKNLTLSVYGRNLFYIYKKMPSMDAEATDGTSWQSQTVIGGSTATTRTFGLSLRASF